MEDWERQRYEKAKLTYAAFISYYPFTTKDLDGEEWRVVEDFDGYRVSNFGRVKSFKRGKAKILKPTLTQNGYLHVALYKFCKQYRYKIHRLVAEMFIPNIENKPEINHIDGCPFNNFVGNLEWATPKENAQHAHDTGLQVNPKGESCSNAKLKSGDIMFIRENAGKITQQQLAEMFGVSRQTISGIQLGQKRKSDKGVISKPSRQRVTEKLKQKIRSEYIKGSKEYGSYALGKKYSLHPSAIIRIVRQ